MNIEDMDIWKKSIELVVKIYQLTSTFPDNEKFGLVSQMRRAAVSIPSNLAEGSARNTSKDYVRFLYISLGSISEIQTQFVIANKLAMINQQEFDEIRVNIANVKKLYLGLIKYLKSKYPPNSNDSRLTTHD